jgi:hypothetical protein
LPRNQIMTHGWILSIRQMSNPTHRGIAQRGLGVPKNKPTLRPAQIASKNSKLLYIIGTDKDLLGLSSQ